VLGSRPVPDDVLKKTGTFENAPLDWVSQ